MSFALTDDQRRWKPPSAISASSTREYWREPDASGIPDAFVSDTKAGYLGVLIPQGTAGGLASRPR
jgi:hypothetical protein